MTATHSEADHRRGADVGRCRDSRIGAGRRYRPSRDPRILMAWRREVRHAKGTAEETAVRAGVHTAKSLGGARHAAVVGADRCAALCAVAGGCGVARRSLVG